MRALPEKTIGSLTTFSALSLAVVSVQDRIAAQVAVPGVAFDVVLALGLLSAFALVALLVWPAWIFPLGRVGCRARPATDKDLTRIHRLAKKRSASRSSR